MTPAEMRQELVEARRIIAGLDRTPVPPPAVIRAIHIRGGR